MSLRVKALSPTGVRAGARLSGSAKRLCPSGNRGTPWHTTKRVTVATVVVAWRRVRPVGGACGYASAMHRRKAGRYYLNELQDA